MTNAVPILCEPDPTLRKRSREVELSKIGSPEINEAIAKMTASLEASDDGIGIAAPQIGIPFRIFLVSEEARHIDEKDGSRDREKKWRNFVFINPVLTKFSRERAEAVEGCLSVPGKYGFVSRPTKVHVEAFDENGKKFSYGAAKFFARVIQHELDHLDGILFIDKVTRFVQLGKRDNPL